MRYQYCYDKIIIIIMRFNNIVTLLCFQPLNMHRTQKIGKYKNMTSIRYVRVKNIYIEMQH